MENIGFYFNPLMLHIIYAGMYTNKWVGIPYTYLIVPACMYTNTVNNGVFICRQHLVIDI